MDAVTSVQTTTSNSASKLASVAKVDPDTWGTGPTALDGLKNAMSSLGGPAAARRP